MKSSLKRSCGMAIMGCKILVFGLTCILFAYYISSPLPANVEEPWKVGVLDTLIKITTRMADLLENIGLMRFEDMLYIIAEFDMTEATSDENITVMDTSFSNIPVRLYLPKRKSVHQKPAIIYVHGGGFIAGSCKEKSYDFLNRCTANKLDAVIVGVDYRLSPQYQFPVPLEDILSVIKYFLQDKILAKYGVDPKRICITGDSSGGALAATVAQLMISDPELKNKLKAQALLYPGLQMIDSFTPSYKENRYGPILTREMAIRMATSYVSTDKAVHQAVLLNQHLPQGSEHLLRLLNWSHFLPENYRRNHVYTQPILGRFNFSYLPFRNSSLSPLAVNDSMLQYLPPTYILTCQHDILRDDGLIYVSRLRNAGVKVFHDHIENGIHGVLSFMTSPFYLSQGFKFKDLYISWLEKNL